MKTHFIKICTELPVNFMNLFFASTITIVDIQNKEKNTILNIIILQNYVKSLQLP